jgi:hypothetical protein
MATTSLAPPIHIPLKPFSLKQPRKQIKPVIQSRSQEVKARLVEVSSIVNDVGRRSDLFETNSSPLEILMKKYMYRSKQFKESNRKKPDKQQQQSPSSSPPDESKTHYWQSITIPSNIKVSKRIGNGDRLRKITEITDNDKTSNNNNIGYITKKCQVHISISITREVFDACPDCCRRIYLKK